MRFSTLSLSVFALAVCVDALVQPLLLGDRVPAISAAEFGVKQALGKRQIGIASEMTAPPQCASTCNPANNEINLGCPVTGCCTTTFQTQYYNCLECVGMALKVNDYTAAQANLNLLYMTCVDMGFVLPRLVLPGQKTNDSSSGSSEPAGSAQVPAGGITSSGAVTNTSGALIGLGLQVEELIGLVVLLGLAGLWQ